jgi:hypothetical protein
VCNAGYFGDGAVACAACSADSADATDGNDLDCVCNSGFFGNGSVCTMCDANSVDSTDSNGNDCVCNAGYFGDGQLCTTCAPNSTDDTASNGNDCACNTGYTGDGATCISISECGQNRDNCHADANCTDTLGSFTCECLFGFEDAGNFATGVECADVQECTNEEAHNCHAQSACAETHGSFDCTCNDGWSGTGVECETVPEGFRLIPIEQQATDTTVTIQVELYDSQGDVKAVDTSITALLNDSTMYRPSASAGGGEVAITSGRGSFQMTAAVAGVVSVALIDSAATGLNVPVDALDVEIYETATDNDTPPVNRAFLNTRITFKGVADCDVMDFTDPQLKTLAFVLTRALEIDYEVLTFLGASCSNTTGRRRQADLFDVTVSSQIEANEDDLDVLQDAMANLLVELGRGSGNTRLAQYLGESGVSITVEPSASGGSVVVEGFDCSTDAWTAWSACSKTCGDSPGLQVRSQRCPLRTETRACYVPVCAVCPGTCDPLAACTADTTANTIDCQCPSDLIGFGVAGTAPGCVARTQEEGGVLEGWLHFDNSIVGATGLQQAAYSQAITEALDEFLDCNCASSRFMSAAVLPYDASSFRYQFTIIPPLTPADQTASALNGRFQLLNVSQLNVERFGSLVSRNGWSRVILDSLTTTTTQTSTTTSATHTSITTVTSSTTESSTTSTVTLTTQTLTSATSTVSTATISGTSLNAESNNQAGGGFGSGWARKDTVHLLIALLVTVVVMLVIFQIIYIRRKRQNLLVEHSMSDGGAIGGDGWWQTQGADQDNPLSRHYYPASNAWQK